MRYIAVLLLALSLTGCAATQTTRRGTTTTTVGFAQPIVAQHPRSQVIVVQREGKNYYQHHYSN